ncbi:hypothetical protein PCANC_18436 [Puccinia coronata f. sp. avenae]|uniref:Uncharacterized protein n=1 Tax=Puccinia coronata f. sp. avenae TaxID=200324 RepID=A0A2N5SDX2_9BASI|nr:hypothetical protein PCANC_18436 [Puccinia coronata f. sp. avenae]
MSGNGSRLTVSVPVTVPQLGMDCDVITYGVSGNGSWLTVSIPVTVPQLGPSVYLSQQCHNLVLNNFAAPAALLAVYHPARHPSDIWSSAPNTITLAIGEPLQWTTPV